MTSSTKQLLQAVYNELLKCSLMNNSFTKLSVDEFVSVLNKSIPMQIESGFNISEYELIRSMYKSNSHKFISFITNSFDLQSFILWTNENEILNHFKLNDKVLLTMNQQTNSYEVQLIPESDTVGVNPNDVFIPEDEDREMERVYEYMQSRLSKLNANSL